MGSIGAQSPTGDLAARKRRFGCYLPKTMAHLSFWDKGHHSKYLEVQVHDVQTKLAVAWLRGFNVVVFSISWCRRVVLVYVLPGTPSSPKQQASMP